MKDANKDVHWGLVLLMLLWPVLQVILLLLDLAARQIDSKVFVAISIVVAATGIGLLLGIVFRKRTGRIGGQEEPHYPTWVRAIAWAVLCILVFVTVELGLDKYKRSLGDVILLDDCVTSLQCHQRSVATQRVIARSRTHVDRLNCTATIRESARPSNRIAKLEVVQRDEEEGRLVVIGVGEINYYGRVEVLDVYGGRAFDLKVTLVSTGTSVVDACGALDLRFVPRRFDTKIADVRVISLNKWDKYNLVRILALIALAAAAWRCGHHCKRKLSSWVLRRRAQRAS